MQPMQPVVLLQGFYQRGDRGVPCPNDPLDSGAGAYNDWWWDHLAKQANALAQAGFTAVWLPPATKGASGLDSVGYDVFDDYDLGSKDQAGCAATAQQKAVPTRYGTREQLERCVAVMRANGLDVYIDVVDDQRDGGKDPDACTFTYLDAYGTPDQGRFPKYPSSFHGYGNPPPIPPFQPPFVPQDPNVYDGAAETFLGCDLAPINGHLPGNAQPDDSVFKGLLDAADWMIRALGVQGYRIDNGKGLSTDYLYHLRHYGAMADKFAVVEFLDGSHDALTGWLYNPRGMNGCCGAFDYPLHLCYLVPMCNTPAAFDMRSLDHAGLAGSDAFHAVTFAENHDTESHPEIPKITQNKMLAYAYILTSEGYPCVFYKDYSTDPGCLGLKPHLDKLVWIHQNIAAGPTLQRWESPDLFVFERLSGQHLLVGLNKNPQPSNPIQVATGFAPNTTLHDYAGHAPDVQTDGQGQVTITIPANTGGLGYVCYSQVGIGSGHVLAAQSVTQEYEGANDLDIRPADNVAAVQICRVYAAAGTAISGALDYNTTDWTANTSIKLVLSDSAGNQIAMKDYLAQAYSSVQAQGASMVVVAGTRDDWYTFTIQSFNTPATNQKPSYKLTVTYTAPQIL